MSELSDLLWESSLEMDSRDLVTQEERTPEEIREALERYQAQVRQLDAGGLITTETLGEPHEGSSLSRRIGVVADYLIGSLEYESRHSGLVAPLFQEGTSIVVVDGTGHLRGHYHKPLADETVVGFGNHLAWGLLNYPASKIAIGQRGRDIDSPEGYAAFTRVKHGLEEKQDHTAIEFKDRPHLGSALVTKDLGRYVTRGPNDWFYASTSGMLVSEAVIDDIMDGPEHDELTAAAKEAVSAGAHDCFEGNIFIGGLETMFSRAVMEAALYNRRIDDIVHEWSLGLSPVLDQLDHGINPH